MSHGVATAHQSSSPKSFRPSAFLLKLLPPTEYSDDVNALYDDLPDDVREKISIEDVAEYIDKGQTERLWLADSIKTRQLNGSYVSPILSVVRTQAEKKLFRLSLLKNVTPRDIDVLIAQSLSDKEYKTRRARDPSSYTQGGMWQSYETLTFNSLVSSRTVHTLQGDSVHFMMFAKGETQISCTRFSFGENPLFSSSTQARNGNPSRIEEGFCQLLGISKDGLEDHALRLEMIQDILRAEGFDEQQVQALFSHWLGELVRHLDGEDGDLRVTNVSGMQPLQVDVEVCNEYLEKQNKPVINNRSGKRVPLSIKSDVAVCMKSLQDTQKACLYSSYIIEMKKALTLRNSAMDAKSQILAESLARSLVLGEKVPKILYSLLCDGLCLHVLIHFPESKVAYLSHRELEPGRMTCVVAWLHKLSARKDVALEEFLDMGFSIGDLLEDEVKDVVNKKRGQEKPNQAPSKTSRQPKRTIEKERTSGGEEMCIDVVAYEERNRQEEEQNQLTAFTRMQNYYRYGDSLPLTEAILMKNVQQGEHEQLSAEENLSRAGFVELSKRNTI